MKNEKYKMKIGSALNPSFQWTCFALLTVPETELGKKRWAKFGTKKFQRL